MKEQLNSAQKFRMSIVFTVFMLWFTISGAYAVVEDLLRYNYREVPGTVMATKQSEGVNMVTLKVWTPKMVTDIEYAYTVDGKEYRRKESSDSLSDIDAQTKYAKGQKLAVYVNPNNPAIATIWEPRTLGTDEFIFALVALAGVIGVIQSIRYWREMKKEGLAWDDRQGTES